MIRGAVKAISRPATYQPNKSASGLSLSPPIAAKTMQATIKITTYAVLVTMINQFIAGEALKLKIF